MNDNAKYVENPEPDWSISFFWEDITFIVQRILEFIRSLFN